MERHLDQDLSALKNELLRMASLTERSLAEAMKALVQRDDELAHRVDEYDNDLDQLQIEIDDRCIKLFALRQPTAGDLRFVAMSMKI